MKTFNAIASSTPVESFAFAGNQAEKAKQAGATRAFRSAFIQGDVKRLPKYMLTAIAAAGFRPVYLGGTTFKHSVIGLVPTHTFQTLVEMFDGDSVVAGAWADACASIGLDVRPEVGDNSAWWRFCCEQKIESDNDRMVA